jgi:hypothetical protein
MKRRGDWRGAKSKLIFFSPFHDVCLLRSYLDYRDVLFGAIRYLVRINTSSLQSKLRLMVRWWKKAKSAKKKQKVSTIQAELILCFMVLNPQQLRCF